MASLRARLIVGLVALAAVGLLALAGITYAEQRSFLLDRVDRQAQSAAPSMDRALDDAGVPSPDDSRPGGRPGPGGGKGFGPPPDENAGLPPGTYGQRRDADGGVLGDTAISSLGEEDLAKPKLPASMPAGRVITVGAQGDSDLRYRAVAIPDDRGSGSLVVAVPLTEVDQTLDRLLFVEALVVAAVLFALGGLSWFLVRLGLRPLDRIGETAGAIAAGDLSRRVSPPRPRPRWGGWASRSTPCSGASSRPSQSVRPARAGCGAFWPTPRTSCARRWPRSAATPSCSASAGPATPPGPRTR